MAAGAAVQSDLPT